MEKLERVNWKRTLIWIVLEDQVWLLISELISNREQLTQLLHLIFWVGLLFKWYVCTW